MAERTAPILPSRCSASGLENGARGSRAWNGTCSFDRQVPLKKRG